MKKLLLGAGLILLSACGSPSTPAPTTTPTSPTTPADAPPDATVSKEFIFNKRQTRAVLASLNLQPLDTVDLGNRLRVVLSVTRAKSGKNIGQKRASAVFIWGNQTVNLSGAYILGLGKTGELGTLTAYNGKMNLAVTYPDYQAKVTKNTPYSTELGELCARLTFNLKAGAQVWSSNTPVEVCEGQATRAQEEAQVSKAASKLLYTYQSLARSRVTFTRLSSQASAAPTPADVLKLLGLPAQTKITTQDTMSFISPIYYAPGGVLIKEAQGFMNLDLVMHRFYRDIKVYRVRLSDERERIVLLGWNSFGVAGVQFMRFYPPDGSPDPAYGAAKTYPSLWRDGGSVVGTVQVGPHDPAATITGRYAVRPGATCEAGVNVTLDKQLQYDQTFLADKGQSITQFTIEAMPDEGQDVIVDYALTISYGGQSKTYTGVVCDILTPPPPPPPPSVDDVSAYPYFYSDPRYSEPPAGGGVSLSGFDGDIPMWGYTGTMTASGTYTIENAPECGASSRATLSTGNLVYEVLDYVEMAGFGLAVPPAGLENLTASSRLVYTVTLTGKDGPRTMQGARCIDWTDPPPPPDPVGPWQPQEVMQDGSIRIFGTSPSPNSWNFRSGTFYWVENGQASLLPHENRDGYQPSQPGLWTYNLNSSLILVYPPAGSDGSGRLEIRP